MKELIKKLVILSFVMVIVLLSIVKLYGVYATGQLQQQASYTFDLTGTTTIEVPANGNKTIYYRITNTNAGRIKYAVGYTSAGSEVYIYNNSPDSETGFISQDDSKTVKLRIENTSNNDDEVEISTVTGYENGGDLIVPSTITLVTEKVYTVTFDPAGGNSPIATKVVRAGEIYGNLPTPTKTGYRFLGWNGKNMFNSSILLTATGWTEENGVYSGDVRYLYDKWNPESSGEYLYTNFKANTVYTASFVTKNETTSGGFRFGFKYVNPNAEVSRTPVNSNTTDFARFYVTSSTDESIFGLYVTYNTRQTVWLKEIQLEEGSTATTYEPYYVTNNVIVSREYDHTLTAIWEEDNS